MVDGSAFSRLILWLVSGLQDNVRLFSADVCLLWSQANGGRMSLYAVGWAGSGQDAIAIVDGVAPPVMPLLQTRFLFSSATTESVRFAKVPDG